MEKENQLLVVPESISQLIDRKYGKSKDEFAKQVGLSNGNYDYGAGGSLAENGHYGDIGKMPWHPTFSDQSKYSNDNFKGGTWTNEDSPNTMYNPNPKMSYTPSADMINSGTTNGLVQYMKRVEPGVELKVPDGYIIDGNKIVEDKIKQKDNLLIESLKNISIGLGTLNPERNKIYIKTAGIGIRG